MNDEEVDRAMLCRLIGLPLACSNCPFIAVQGGETWHGIVVAVSVLIMMMVDGVGVQAASERAIANRPE